VLKIKITQRLMPVIPVLGSQRQEDRKFKTIWAPVAHTYNLSYSEDRDQEDRGSKQTLGDSSQDPISKIPNTKKRAGSNPQYH
jgi:hypothetical protein